jgi:hypothetical protein
LNGFQDLIHEFGGDKGSQKHLMKKMKLYTVTKGELLGLEECFMSSII